MPLKSAALWSSRQSFWTLYSELQPLECHSFNTPFSRLLYCDQWLNAVIFSQMNLRTPFAGAASGSPSRDEWCTSSVARHQQSQATADFQVLRHPATPHDSWQFEAGEGWSCDGRCYWWGQGLFIQDADDHPMAREEACRWHHQDREQCQVCNWCTLDVTVCHLRCAHWSTSHQRWRTYVDWMHQGFPKIWRSTTLPLYYWSKWVPQHSSLSTSGKHLRLIKLQYWAMRLHTSPTMWLHPSSRMLMH